MKDEKYVVFKKSEFDAWWQQPTVGGSHHRLPSPEAVHDAVVIRRQDVFAPPALDAYANGITVVLEILKKVGVSPDIVIPLEAKADYFHAQAHRSWNTDRKIPD